MAKQKKKPGISEREDILFWLDRNLHDFMPLKPTRKIKLAYRQFRQRMVAHTISVLHRKSARIEGDKETEEKLDAIIKKKHFRILEARRYLEQRIINHQYESDDGGSYEDDENEDDG